jgi:hypothetical protein
LPRSEPAGWARCTGPATRDCNATSRSRACRRRSPGIRIGSPASSAKRACSHRSTTRTWANVKVRLDGTVKVLDFGLAKAYGDDANPASASTSPTLTYAGTQAGIVLGTAAYMAPEQARGQVVDKRADVWAFGVLLWEMLTGSRLFGGDTTSDVLAAVLTRTPVSPAKRTSASAPCHFDSGWKGQSKAGSTTHL